MKQKVGRWSFLQEGQFKSGMRRFRSLRVDRLSLRTVTRRPYSQPQLKQTEPSLQVSEIFKSIQGEGPHTGHPSIFLRLGLCNLTCIWCDTPYTWLYKEQTLQKLQSRAERAYRPELSPNNVYDKKAELQKRPLDCVYEDVTELADSSVKGLVITGGEPLLHKKPLLELVPRFLRDGFRIEFETNGTISPVGLDPNVHLNVSPKLSNSLIPHDTRINIRTLQQCLSFPSSILKFVVDSEKDLHEVLHLVSQLEVHPSRVYLMPQGTVSHSHKSPRRVT